MKIRVELEDGTFGTVSLASEPGSLSVDPIDSVDNPAREQNLRAGRQLIELLQRANPTVQPNIHAEGIAVDIPKPTDHVFSSAYLAILSDELRNRLNVIAGWAKMLQDGSISEQQMRDRALEAISRSAKDQLRVLDGLRTDIATK
jgi:signal transduction histidine kinase